MLKIPVSLKKILTLVLLMLVLGTGIWIQSHTHPISAREAAVQRVEKGYSTFSLPGSLASADWSVLCGVNRLNTTPVGYVLGWTTHLGSKGVLLPLIALLVLIWDTRRFFRRFGFLAAVLLAQEGLVAILKHWIARPRPFILAAQGASPCAVDVLFAPPDFFSMPSGHAAAALAAATLICGIYGPRFRFLYAVAAVIAVSRLFVGVHFPSDILAGGLLGTVWAFTALSAGKPFHQS